MDQPSSAFLSSSKGDRRSMKLWEKIMWALLVLIALFVIYVTVDANKFATQVRVVQENSTVGVNPTTESLDFGDLSRGSSAGRKVKIENKTPFPMFISVLELGDIRDLLTMPKNNFRVDSNASTEVEFFVTLPASAEVDHIYKGRVIIFRIPTFF